MFISLFLLKYFLSRYTCFGIALDTEVDKFQKCYLDHICVSETARGKGVGKILMQRAEYEARLRNCTVRFFLYMVDFFLLKNVFYIGRYEHACRRNI